MVQAQNTAWKSRDGQYGAGIRLSKAFFVVFHGGRRKPVGTPIVGDAGRTTINAPA
jgi:hypothetical protein